MKILKQNLVLEQAAEHFIKDFVVDGIEILPYVEFYEPNVFFCIAMGEVYCCVCAFATARGKTLVYLMVFKFLMADQHHRLKRHPLLEIGGADEPLFRVADGKKMIIAEPERAVKQPTTKV